MDSGERERAGGMKGRNGYKERGSGGKEGGRRKNETRSGGESERKEDEYEEIDLGRNTENEVKYEGRYTQNGMQDEAMALSNDRINRNNSRHEESGLAEERGSYKAGTNAGINIINAIKNIRGENEIRIDGQRSENGVRKWSSKIRLTRTQRKNQNHLFRALSRPFRGVSVGGWRLWAVGGLVYCSLLLLQPSPFAFTPEEDATNLREWVKENEAALREVYRERGRNAHDVCAHYDVYMGQAEYIKETDAHREKLQYSDWFTLKRVNWNYVYYAPKEDFVYCKVPKSGSSTWVYNLLKLANAPQDQISSDIGLHKLLRDYYPKMTSSKMKRVFKKSFKLLVVRHPFERVLSAYRDKLESYQRDLMFRDGYYYTMYGKNIVKVYRDTSDHSLANRTEPTWKEFVRYVINSPPSKFDEHWKPIYALCSPCVVKYDVIATMESFSEDTQYVINQLGLEETLQVEWIHRNTGAATSDIAVKYFSQLTKHQVDQLYAKYQLDFELFGYEYEAYRDMAKL